MTVSPSVWQRVAQAPPGSVLARIVATTGGAPRPVGTAMLISPDSATAWGSLTGGCIEAEVLAAADDVRGSGAATVLTFSGSDDEFAISLPCGGSISILVHEVNAPDIVGRIVASPTERHRLVTDLTTGAWHLGDESPVLVGGDQSPVLVGGDQSPGGTFVQVFAPSPRMLLCGANDYARALATLGRHLGYRVTVVDARETFTSAADFDGADVVTAWPQRYLAAQDLTPDDAVIVLTHDDKFAIDTLAQALAQHRGYVGALGSRRTQLDRRHRLRAAGVSAAALQRLHGPIGLDLGGNSPAEVAVAVAAELIAERSGHKGRPLSDTDDPIH